MSERRTYITAVASVFSGEIAAVSNAAYSERVNDWFNPGSAKSIRRLTNNSLLLILAVSCVSVATCDAVNVTKPHAPATGVIIPDDESIVAIPVLLDVYTIGAELLLVGNVVGEHGRSVFNLYDGTMNDVVDNVFIEFTTTVRDPAIRRIAFTPYVKFSTTAPVR